MTRSMSRPIIRPIDLVAVQHLPGAPPSDASKTPQVVAQRPRASIPTVGNAVSEGAAPVPTADEHRAAPVEAAPVVAGVPERTPSKPGAASGRIVLGPSRCVDQNWNRLCPDP